MIELATAFMLGLMGGGHCLFMCGGLVSAFALAQQQPKNLWIPLGCACCGRLLSYAACGFFLGYLITSFDYYSQSGPVLRSLGGIMLILMGLYLGNWYKGLKKIEQLGSLVWRPLKRFFRSDFNSPLGAMSFGILWGFLPCGLVYSALLWASTTAVSSGNPFADSSLDYAISPLMQQALWSALIMGFFGLGTLPIVFTTGYFAHRIRLFFKKTYTRVISAGLIVLFGIWTLAAPWLMINQDH